MKNLSLAVALLAALLAACGSSDDPEPGASEASCVEPKSQAVSQPCCLAHGIDACGALLFCAAFDGRAQPTCYPERSRADLSECTEDRQCQSGSCNTDQRKCRSVPTTTCSTDVGCAPDPQGTRYFCNPQKSPAICDPVGNGLPSELCEKPSDCANGMCTENRCVVPFGERCEQNSDCSEGACADCADRMRAYCRDGVTEGHQCLPACTVSGAYFYSLICFGGASCVQGEQCETGQCSGTCQAGLGDGCLTTYWATQEPCTTGYCVPCGLASNVECVHPEQHPAECLQQCDGGERFALSCN